MLCPNQILSIACSEELQKVCGKIWPEYLLKHNYHLIDLVSPQLWGCYIQNFQNQNWGSQVFPIPANPHTLELTYFDKGFINIKHSEMITFFHSKLSVLPGLEKKKYIFMGRLIFAKIMSNTLSSHHLCISWWLLKFLPYRVVFLGNSNILLAHLYSEAFLKLKLEKWTENEPPKSKGGMH